jgi:hypothetical protein
MAVTAYWYGKAFLSAFNKEIDLNEATKIKVMLCTNAYVPDQDAHDYKDDVTNEVVGAGYVAGGAELTTLSPTYTAGTNVFAFNADDVTWAAATITARYAVVYYNTGVDGTSPLICYIDFGADVTSTAGNFTITWDAGGICKVTVS